MALEFKKHFVRNTDTNKKCRVSYHKGAIFINGELKECVSLYAKSCLDSMQDVIIHSNDSEYNSDYVVEDIARIFPNHPQYKEALAFVWNKEA